MKRIIIFILICQLCMCCAACNSTAEQIDIVATTLPVYEITVQICSDTELHISQLITENISCLHDYTLNPSQMKLSESADLLIISGAGFEEFMEDVISSSSAVADASSGISLHHAENHHGDEHDHEYDPHIWLSPENGRIMAENIHAALCGAYPEHKTQFDANLIKIQRKFDEITAYGHNALQALSCYKIITFHDGFSYMAESFGLQILQSFEEESGSEASVADLIAICDLIERHQVPAIFTEKNGSDRAAIIISNETGAKIYQLDTGLSGSSYFDAIYHNIDTLKEALG